MLLTWLGAFVVAAALIAGLAEPAPRAAGVSGTVATALGLGGLVGAAALIQWPPTAAPRRGLTLTTAVLGACCLLAGLVGAADRVVLVIVAFFLLGLVNAPHTVFSLASREELSPPHLKREVFIAVAGSKVGFSSAGTAAAGLLIGAGPNQLLLGLGLVCAAAAAMAAATLRRSARRRTRLRPTQVSPMTEPHWP